jgi:hypothetical protein
MSNAKVRYANYLRFVFVQALVHFPALLCNHNLRGVAWGISPMAQALLASMIYDHGERWYESSKKFGRTISKSYILCKRLHNLHTTPVSGQTKRVTERDVKG